MSELASAIGMHSEEAALVAELKAGSEEAYAWLVAQHHQSVYSLVYRILGDAADAADTTQEVFLKVFRGMRTFNGQASLKTVSGGMLIVMMNGPNNLILKDEQGDVADITTYDVLQSNGVIHSIDKVLLPR